MQFKNEKERDELIKGFETKAKSLTDSMKKEIPENTEVIFETITEWGENVEASDSTEDNKKYDKTGNIFVAYIKQPHILTAVKVLDMLAQQRMFEAGMMAWDAMIISVHSSKEIENYSLKLGLVGRLGWMLKASVPDLKKN